MLGLQGGGGLGLQQGGGLGLQAGTGLPNPNTAKAGGGMQQMLKDPKAMMMLAQMMQQGQGRGALAAPMQMPMLPQAAPGQAMGALSPYARRR